MPEMCEKRCGECGRCVGSHAQLAIDEKDAEIQELKLQLDEARRAMRLVWNKVRLNGEEWKAFDRVLNSNDSTSCDVRIANSETRCGMPRPCAVHEKHKL